MGYSSSTAYASVRVGQRSSALAAGCPAPPKPRPEFIMRRSYPLVVIASIPPRPRPKTLFPIKLQLPGYSWCQSKQWPCPIVCGDNEQVPILYSRYDVLEYFISYEKCYYIVDWSMLPERRRYLQPRATTGSKTRRPRNPTAQSLRPACEPQTR